MVILLISAEHVTSQNCFFFFIEHESFKSSHMIQNREKYLDIENEIQRENDNKKNDSGAQQYSSKDQ